MKLILYLLVFLIGSSRLFSQTGMENDCLKKIIDSTADIKFPIYSSKIVVTKDTFKFGSNQFIVSLNDSLTQKIINSGLFYPGLIASARTDGSGKFQPPTIQFIGSIKIGNIKEMRFTEGTFANRAFSFIVWRDHLANPFLYLFQLTNKKATPETNLDEFIKGAQLSAFGFCSILL